MGWSGGCDLSSWSLSSNQGLCGVGSDLSEAQNLWGAAKGVVEKEMLSSPLSSGSSLL